MYTRPCSSSITVLTLCVYSLASPAYAAPQTFGDLYFRRTIADPFTDPGYYESAYGTNLTSLSHTSPRGSVARLTANAAEGTIKAFADAVNGNIAAGIGGDEAWARGHVSDTFTLDGPDPGTPMSIAVYYTVGGTLSGTGGDPFTIESQENALIASRFVALSHNEEFSRWARSELAMGRSWEHGGGSFYVPIHQETRFELDIVAGTPFDIYYALDARGGWAYGGSGGTSDFGATAAITFELPRGTRVTSEGGFTQSNPIPEPSVLVFVGCAMGGLVLRGIGRRRRMENVRGGIE